MLYLAPFSKRFTDYKVHTIMTIENEDFQTFETEETEESPIINSEHSPIVSKVTSTIPVEDRRWFCLRVISGKEKKIKERIELEMLRSAWHDAVFSVIVPTEKVYKVRNGKKVITERNLLPGYILVEAYGPKLNGDVSKVISDITNVIHFLGKDTPIPMTMTEARRLLGIVDDNSASAEVMIEPYLVGEVIKVIDGPFTDFVGDVQKVDDEKKKLTVIVKIFGRGTEVELNFMQVEKIN
jgi:transcription termination/antitermination protein NusG